VSWFVRHPLHSGVIVGLIVALTFGLFSFPSERSIEKQIDDWLPQRATSDPAEINQMITALEEAQAGERSLTRISEDEFRELELARSYASPEGRADGSFEIRYIGQADESDAVYLAEREVHAAPWWHPDRLLYRAASHEIDRFGEGLRLTYDRDWDQLGGLLIMDALVGLVYGGIVGLILSVFGAKELDVPGGTRNRKIQAEAPLDIFRPAKLPQIISGAAPGENPSRFR
jgi:hypothetical protein